jgi:hypothetical protein
VPFAKIGYADEQLPGAGRQRSGKIGWRCIRDANAECVFVAAAPSAKALWIEQPEVKRGVIFPAGIAERDIQPFDAGRHFERDQDVAVRLLVVEGAVEIEILSVKGGEAEEEKQKATKME